MYIVYIVHAINRDLISRKKKTKKKKRKRKFHQNFFFLFLLKTMIMGTR